MNKKGIIFTLLLIILLGSFLLLNVEKTNAAEVGKKAPNFTLKNMNGNKVTLRDLEGEKVFINFWASWCPPCQTEMPDIQKLYKNHGNDIKIIAINLEEKKEKVKKYLENENLTFPVLLDKNKKVASKYLVRAIPTSYFINENGIITAKHLGILNYEDMKKNLKIN